MKFDFLTFFIFFVLTLVIFSAYKIGEYNEQQDWKQYYETIRADFAKIDASFPIEISGYKIDFKQLDRVERSEEDDVIKG